jgi:hypothetical protein
MRKVLALQRSLFCLLRCPGVRTGSAQWSLDRVSAGESAAVDSVLQPARCNRLASGLRILHALNLQGNGQRASTRTARPPP